MAARYRQAELEAFTLDEGVDLTHSKVSRAAELLGKDDARLLHYCRTFRTLDKHALQWSREAKFQNLQDLSNVRMPRFLSRVFDRFRNYAEQHGSEIAVDAKALASAKERLEAFAALGFLVSDENLVRRVNETQAGSAADRPSVAALGMATRGREEILRRGIASYLDNSAKFGRSVEVIVVDDALESALRQRTQAVLEELKNDRGATLRYASRGGPRGVRRSTCVSLRSAGRLDPIRSAGARAERPHHWLLLQQSAARHDRKLLCDRR